MNAARACGTTIRDTVLFTIIQMLSSSDATLDDHRFLDSDRGPSRTRRRSELIVVA